MATKVDPSDKFDLVKAAEALLASAKKLATMTAPESAGPSSSGAAEMNLRRGISMAAKKVAFEVTPPIEVVKAEWTVLANIASWSIFMEWKVFDQIPLDDPAGISISDLARAVDAQESLIGRIASFLVSTGTLLSVPGNPSHVRHSRISPLYCSTHPASPLAVVATNNALKPYASWATYFATYGRREPPSVNHTPFSFSWGHPELPPWEVKALFPEYASAFAKAMKSRAMVGGGMALTGPEALYDFAWVGEEAEKKKKLGSGAVVVVDVGGGLGQLLQDVVREVPGVSPSQCVLQDRKEVLEDARQIEDPVLREVVMMEHDFHTEQPVKGAAVYVLRRILLDYPDELAVEILKRLADALPAAVDDPRARVLVMEERLMEVPIPMNRLVDLVMLNLGGKLRNKDMFAKLARASGMKLTGYYAREGDPNVVVELGKE